MRLRALILLLSLIIVQVSCNKTQELKKVNLMTQGEDRGIEDILKFYGGECKYHVGFTSSRTGTMKYFKIELSRSKMAERYDTKAALVTSNVALLFCKNLSENGLENYQKIIVSVDLNERKIIHEYIVKDVQIVIKSLSSIKSIVSLLERKDSIGLNELLQPSGHFMYDKKNLISRIIYNENINSSISYYKIAGFKFFSIDNQVFLSVFGLLVRDKSSTELKIILNPISYPSELTVLAIDYSWQ